MKRKSLFVLAAMSVVFLVCPSPASAHLNSTGMGPMYDGLLHFFLSPEDIVPVVALALLGGLRGPQYGRRALCFATILSALKIARFLPAEAVPSRLSLHPRAPRISPGRTPARYICIY
jgi:hypothetical protein